MCVRSHTGHRQQRPEPGQSADHPASCRLRQRIRHPAGRAQRPQHQGRSVRARLDNADQHRHRDVPRRQSIRVFGHGSNRLVLRGAHPRHCVRSRTPRLPELACLRARFAARVGHRDPVHQWHRRHASGQCLCAARRSATPVGHTRWVHHRRRNRCRYRRPRTRGNAGGHHRRSRRSPSLSRFGGLERDCGERLGCRFPHRVAVRHPATTRLEPQLRRRTDRPQLGHRQSRNRRQGLPVLVAGDRRRRRRRRLLPRHIGVHPAGRPATPARHTARVHHRRRRRGRYR